MENQNLEEKNEVENEYVSFPVRDKDSNEIIGDVYGQYIKNTYRDEINEIIEEMKQDSLRKK